MGTAHKLILFDYKPVIGYVPGQKGCMGHFCNIKVSWKEVASSGPHHAPGAKQRRGYVWKAIYKDGQILKDLGKPRFHAFFTPALLLTNTVTQGVQDIQCRTQYRTERGLQRTFTQILNRLTTMSITLLLIIL